MLTRENAAALVQTVKQAQGGVMKVEMRRGTIIDGKHRDPGEIVEVNDTFAKEFLFRTGKAVPVEKAKESETATTKEPAENAAKRTGRGGRKKKEA